MAYPEQNQVSQGSTEEFGRSSNVSRVMGDVRERAKQYAEDMQLQARYDEARFWMREHRSTLLIALGVIASAGVAGYFFSKRRRDYY